MRTAARLIQLLLAAVLGLTLVRTHLGTPPPGDRPALVDHALPVLRQLEQHIREGAAYEMQSVFPEGFLFTHALTGLAWIDVGLAHPVDHPLRAEAHRQAVAALKAVTSADGRAPFPAHLSPPYGAFYAGWTNHLRAGALLLLAPTDRSAVQLGDLSTACSTIAKAYDDSDVPWLPSYEGAAWPVDNVVAVSSLTLCDHLLGAQYSATRARWLRLARAATSTQTGTLGHAAFEGERAPRGTSTAVMLRFMHEIDPDWARAHYDVFRSRFVTSRVGLPGVQEYLDGRGGAGDVDSGPLPFGISLSATVVGGGVATLYGDHGLSAAIFGIGEALAFPLQWGGRRSYAFGLLPVGDAFVVWSKTVRPWLTEPRTVETPSAIPPWWWRLVWAPLGWLLVLFLIRRSVSGLGQGRAVAEPN